MEKHSYAINSKIEAFNEVNGKNVRTLTLIKGLDEVTSPRAQSENRFLLRKNLRNVRGELKCASSGMSKQIGMLDISEGGIAFISSLPYTKGSSWTICFTLGLEKFHAEIRIVDCINHAIFTDIYRVCAEFITPNSGV